MNTNTTVSSETIDLSELFPGAVEEEKKETSFFSKDSTSMDIKDIEDDEEDEGKEKKGADKDEDEEDEEDIPKKKTAVLEVEDLAEDQQEFEDAKSSTKTTLIEFFKTRIESGELVAFNDYDEKTPLEGYLKKFSKKDFDELWKANMKKKEDDLVEEVPKAFQESLPRELQYAAQYVQDGGTDMKGLFKALGQVEDIKSLDPNENARELSKQYLTATQFGTDEEISEQLDEWEDLGVIKKKAAGFKPKLDKLGEDILNQKIAQQASIKEKEKEQYQYYVNNVIEAVQDQDLYGVALDKKTQTSLYSGLTQHAFINSTGKKCTEFEYLLDKCMWLEPDYKTLAMVQWLLKDREGFMDAVSNKETNKQVEGIVRNLKTNQGNSIKNTSQEGTPVKRTTKLARPSGLFKR